MKKIMYTMILVSIFVLAFLSIRYMYGTEEAYEIDDKEMEIEAQIESNGLEGYTVDEGDISSKYVLEGRVTDENSSSKKIYKLSVADKLFVVEGQTAIKGNVIFKKNGKNYYADSFMKCLNIVRNNNNVEITFVDYGSLFIECSIPIDMIEGNMYSKEYIISNANNRFKATLDYINGYVEDNKIYAKFNYCNDRYLMHPGTSVDIIFTKEKENVICIPKEYVVVIDKDKSQYEVSLINSDGTYSEKEVELGLIGDEMVEIKAGISRGDKILYPTGSMTLENMGSELVSDDKNL